MMTRAPAAASLLVLLWCASACEGEKRVLGASAPVTAPTGSKDPRVKLYASNKYQESQGGLYFTWYGCGSCHAQTAPKPQNFASQHFLYGGDIASLYDSISDGRGGGMPAYKDRIPSQQIWQLAAYVKSLPKMNPYLRRREDLDEKPQPTTNSPPGGAG